MEDMLCCKRICFNHKDIRSDYKLNYSEILLKQFVQICKTQLKKNRSLLAPCHIQNHDTESF